MSRREHLLRGSRFMFDLLRDDDYDALKKLVDELDPKKRRSVTLVIKDLIEMGVDKMTRDEQDELIIRLFHYPLNN